MGWRWGEAVSSTSVLWLLKSVVGLLPRSSPIMGHRPPFVFWSSLCRSRKVLLCLLVLSFAVCLQPPSMWVLFRGDRHFVHMGVGPCPLLHLCTWTPQATSRESLRTCSIWGCRVSVDGVICSFFSCLTEYSVCRSCYWVCV